MPRFVLALVLLVVVGLVGACTRGDTSTDEPPSSGGQSSDPAKPSATADGLDVISPEEAKDLVEGGASLIDVRTVEEYIPGHLKGAANIPLESEDFDDEVADLDKDATYVLYCASGRRAGIALEKMQDAGFTDVHNAGGFEELAGVVAPAEAVRD